MLQGRRTISTPRASPKPPEAVGEAMVVEVGRLLHLEVRGLSEIVNLPAEPLAQVTEI